MESGDVERGFRRQKVTIRTYSQSSICLVSTFFLNIWTIRRLNQSFPYFLNGFSYSDLFIVFLQISISVSKALCFKTCLVLRIAISRITAYHLKGYEVFIRRWNRVFDVFINRLAKLIGISIYSFQFFLTISLFTHRLLQHSFFLFYVFKSLFRPCIFRSYQLSLGELACRIVLNICNAIRNAREVVR